MGALAGGMTNCIQIRMMPMERASASRYRLLSMVGEGLPQGIQAAFNEGVATNQSPDGQGAAAPQTISLDGLTRILRARRSKSTGRWQQGRQHALVDQQKRRHRTPGPCHDRLSRAATRRNTS